MIAKYDFLSQTGGYEKRADGSPVRLLTTRSSHPADPNHGAFHEELDASASLPIRRLASQRHRRAPLRHFRHRSHRVMISSLSSL